MFPLLLAACGGHRASAPVATTAGVAPPHEPCHGSDAALAELDQLRLARGVGEDLATMLRVQRAVIEAGQLRRPSAPRANAVFAEAEQDAEKRAAALERYAGADEEAQLGATDAVRRLDNACFFERLLAKAAKKPAPNAAQKRLDCERFSQIRQGVRWEDARSVSALADAIESLQALPPERVRESTARARLLSTALGGAAAERAIFMAPQDVLTRAERSATAMFGTCHSEAASVPALVAAPEPNERALTVIVSAKPPRGLGPHFERAALSATGDEAQLYRSVAAGRYGSGFLVVIRGEGGARETFVVTNRHVADLASSLTIKVEGGASFEATPLFIDPRYDLAVLGPNDPAQKLAPLGGFDLAARPPLDGEAVTATGYPGLLGEPSFQLTKGHVSNASVVFADTKLQHVQHTAAIDPGSSGGPLLGARHEVLGANTFKLVGREAVAIAVPADAVARAIASARTAARCDGVCKKKAAEDACLSLVSELSHAEPSTTAIPRMLGESIVAEHGIASHNVIVDSDASIHTRFKTSPVATLSEAVARRLIGDVREAGGVHPVETCGGMRRAKNADGKTIAVSIALMDGQRDLTFSWDGSRWRLGDYPFSELDLAPVRAPAPAAPAVKKKGPSPAKKTAKP